MSLKRIFGVLLSLCVLVSADGCGGLPSTPGTDPMNTSQADVDQTGLNLINTCADGTPLDVYVNGKLMAAVDFRAATGFLKVDPGKVRVDVRVKGALATSTPILSTDLDVDVKAKLSLAVVGRVDASLNVSADVDASVKLGFVKLSAGVVDRTKVKVRVLNASAAADIDLSANAKLLAHAVAKGAVSAYVDLDADLDVGAKLGLKLAGLDIDAAVAAALKAMNKGGLFTVIAIGDILPTCDDDKFLGVSVLDELTGELINLKLDINVSGPKASFYLFHGVADVAAIDLAAKAGAVLHAGIGFGKASPILTVSPGVLALELRAAARADVLLGLNLKLLPGTHWTLYTSGLLKARADLNAKLALNAAVRLLANAGAYVRAINLAVDAAAIDVYAGADVWAKGLLFAKAGAYVKLAATLPLLTLSVKATASLLALVDVVLTQTIIDAMKDQVVTCFVTGAKDLSLGAALSVVAVVESNLTTQPLSCLTLPRL
ncbi:MAG: DUF4397 domain-containing protein [Polyangia bacterium]